MVLKDSRVRALVQADLRIFSSTFLEAEEAADKETKNDSLSQQSLRNKSHSNKLMMVVLSSSRSRERNYAETVMAKEVLQSTHATNVRDKE